MTPLAAARSYAALAAVFGGFTLTAIVLLIQLLIPAEPGGAPRFGGEVTSGIRAVGSSFLVAFSGCIISAFVMTVACAEPERDAPRAHFMLLLGGVSLATSVLLTFWSIASLVALLGFADPSWLPYGFFVALSVLTGLFLTGTALDVLLLSGYHKDSGPRRGDFLGLFSCGIVVGAISFFAWPQWADRNAQLLAAEVLAAIVVVAAAGIAVLVSTFRRSDYRFVRQKTLSRAGRLPSLIAVYALAALPSVVAGALTAIRF